MHKLSLLFKGEFSFLTVRSKAVLLLWILFVISVSCHSVFSVPCSLVVTCWEMADLLALLYVICYCVFVTFQYGVLGQVCFLIVWIPDLCLLPYFNAGPVSILYINCKTMAHTLVGDINTGLDKQKHSALNLKYFLTHQFYHMFWVLKRTVSLRRFF